jgi:hypothetical protein
MGESKPASRLGGETYSLAQRVARNVAEMAYRAGLSS